MKKETYDEISKVVADLYIKALRQLPSDIVSALDSAKETEDDPAGKQVLSLISKNVSIAKTNNWIVCQDTGTPVCIAEIGDLDVNIPDLYKSVKKGVHLATTSNNLRPNMVHPLTRVNTKDNTGIRSPEILIQPNETLGKKIKLTVIPKGSGSENASALYMLTMSEGIEGIKDKVLRWIIEIGGRGCPPYVLGIGIGGSFELAASLAKFALIRPLSERNTDPDVSKLETDLLRSINELGIGPMGVGGKTTALGVNIEWAETHISSLPVAINIECWRDEHASAVFHEDGSYEVR